jgi:glycosyltransferase involved in cell wall biosynthesis
MRHSGYEAIVDFLTNSRVIYAGDFAKLTKLSYPLRLAHILPKSYASLDAELAALRSDGKILHHLYAEDTLWISMFHRFIGSRTVAATFHRPPHVLEATMPFFWKKQVRKLAGVIALSPRQYNYLRSVCGSYTTVSLIPHGIDTNYFTPGKNERSREVILSVGNYLRDPTTLVKAMNILSHKAPGLRLTAVSKQPLPDTKNLIRLTNISDEELLAYYRKASFVVLAFGNLTASNAMLEAMACGLPVICPDFQSARFYMGDTPTTYEPGNANDLADKIIWLYENDDERRKLASEMRERAQLFSWFRISSMMRSFYETILNC